MKKETQQQDTMEVFHDALIQHGPLSNRIYLMKLNHADPAQLIPAMDAFATNHGYTKIFAKIPSCHVEEFLHFGYQQEASIPGFYHGQEEAAFLGRYLTPERQKEADSEGIEKILELAQSKSKQESPTSTLSIGTVLRQCVPQDAVTMAKIYKDVFPSYPFPIDKPDYIIKTMQEHIIYFGIEVNGKLASLSSSEMDTVSKNVEMTDFATLTEFRGNNYSSRLLVAMEEEMASRGIQTAYTIARAVSPGINITFAKAGYAYAGRLVNNTNISGQIESMNVWYKQL